MDEQVTRPNADNLVSEEKLWAGFNQVARRVKAYIDAGGTLETIDERDRAALSWYLEEILNGYQESPKQMSLGLTQCVFTGTHDLKYIFDEMHNMCLPKSAVIAIMWALDKPQIGKATCKEIKNLLAKGATIKKIIETSEKAHP